MGRPAGWMKNLTSRGAMRSPGAPSHRCEIERRFWEQIRTGITSEKAAQVVGVSQAVGTRWFRHRGGMPLFMSKPVSARYLSFVEREEIGLLRAQDVGVRENSAPHWAKPFYGLTRADTQRCNSWRQARVSGICCAVEGRVGGQKTEAGETGDQPATAPLRPRPLGRQGS